MKLKTTLMTLSLMMASHAFADNKLTCQSNAFPAGMGSALELILSADGIPNHATLYLNDPNPQLGGLKTNGSFDALAPTYNEDGTPVIYFQWYGGAGFGENGGEHLNLIPRSMVIYDFSGNYEHDKTVYLGIIEWKDGLKVESHFDFQCAPAQGN